ncbi:MAG: dihydropteroate synthase [Treponema sp.]|nr:dihydropteroate synthase [Treponema sp.]MCR5621172.1 dihydropteroate synthase [Treponema sp.]
MKTLRLADRELSTQRQAFIMGIVNATPDSFYGGSRGGVERALQLVEEGADILDIGGESTRPGSSYITEEEEIRRIVPVIEQIRRHTDIPISVDTRKKAVMEAAWNAGANILNDIAALEDDEALAPFAAQKGMPVILMHKRGTPETMQQDTSYDNVFWQVSSYLEKRAQFAEATGIARDQIIVDPGIGFGKALEENRALIWGCGSLCGGKYPVLMALSRKSCIGTMVGESGGDPGSDGRLYGTLAANMLAVLRGASMLRVHDVKACRNTLDVVDSFRSCIEEDMPAVQGGDE